VPLQVRSEPLPEGPALRSLLLGSLAAALGEVTVLEEALPLPGAPALVLDGEGRPTLVSFDGTDAARALVQGLAALEGLSAAAPWLVGRHPALEAPPTAENLYLLVLGPTPPPGLGRVGTPARLRAGGFRAVRVGDKVGLLVDLMPEAPPAAATSRAVSRARPHPFRTGLVALNAAEKAFFEPV